MANTTHNPQLELAHKFAQFTHRNIFLTGKAGTGKTTFLRQLRQQSKKRMIVVAPTGVAAINAGGVTIHSFFQLAPGMFVPGSATSTKKDQRFKYNFSKHKINILRSLDLLVIDEISMVRCDLLDAIDEVLRRYQNRNLPFGGVQVLMIGDLQQLPPVTTDEERDILRQWYDTSYFFSSIAFRQGDFITIELNTVYRQADPTFIEVLNSVRDNNVTPEILSVLNARFKPNFTPNDNDGYITLTTHNYQASDINARRMMQLPTQEVHFKASVTGEFPELSYPTDADLSLKVGAQVMFCKNDSSPAKAYYNGKIGHVIKIANGLVTVRCKDSLSGNNDEQLIEVGPQEWINSKYVTNETTGEISEEETGKFTQIPLKAAWAITIHKSQGLTFDKAIINAGRAFSHGQVYVALSRCRSLEGLILSTPISAAVISTDNCVRQFNQAVAEHQPSLGDLHRCTLKYVEELLCSLFDYRQFMTRFNYYLRLCDEHIYRQYPKYLASLKELQGGIQAELLDVGSRFQVQIHQLIALTSDYRTNTMLAERFKKGITYFLTKTTELLSDVIEQGVPELDNKALKEQLEREFELLKSDYSMMLQFFVKFSTEGFSLEAYWDAKSVAIMGTDEDGIAKKKNARKTKGSSAKEKTPKKVVVSDNDDIKDPRLYNALRSWRSDKAAELNVPPYHILHNATLIGLVNNRPSNEKELLTIPGIGKKVAAAFGAQILEIIRSCK